jgi:hypothetical protein
MKTEFETPSLPKYLVGGNPSDDPVASKLVCFQLTVHFRILLDAR